MIPLSEQWPWNQSYLKLFLALPAIIGISITFILFPDFGNHALYFLMISFAGVFFYFIYSVVGKKVKILLNCKSAKNGEAVESLLVIGHKQSPGIAILRDDVLILIPIIGRRRKLPLKNITAIKCSRWLPGKFVWGKTAFHLETLNKTPLAFAIAKPVALRWFSKLAKAVPQI